MLFFEGEESSICTFIAQSAIATYNAQRIDLDGIPSTRSQLNSLAMCLERVMKKAAPYLLSPEQGSVGHRALSHFADVCSLLMSHAKMAAGRRGKYNVNGFQTP